MVERSVKSLKGLVACVSAVALCGVGTAHAATWIASGKSSDGALDAQAVITSSANILTIQLTDLLANPTSAGQELSGIEIFFASAPTSASLDGTPTGQLITISNSGKKGATNTWADDNTDKITHWGVAISGDDLYLATAGTGAAGGKPSDLIIDGGTSNNFSNANSSITGHGPEIDGTGVFKVALNGTTTPVIAGVTLEFGTTPDHTVAATCTDCSTPVIGGGQIVAHVPEPAEWVLMIGGFFGAGAVLRARRRARLA